MPMAIPLIAAVGTAVAVPTFFTIAGAVLVAAGTMTGKKDLVKAGSLLSLGGSLAAGFAGAAGSAGSTAGEAVGEGVAGAVVDDVAASGSLGAANTTLAENALAIDPSMGAQLGTQELGSSFAQAAAPSQASMLSTPGLSVMNTAAPAQGTLTGLGGGGIANVPPPGATATSGPLDWLNNIGSHVKQNKELYQMGGQMLQGMFGPDAEMIDLKKQELERRRKNMNSIVPLGQIGMLGKGG